MSHDTELQRSREVKTDWRDLLTLKQAQPVSSSHHCYLTSALFLCAPKESYFLLILLLKHCCSTAVGLLFRLFPCETFLVVVQSTHDKLSLSYILTVLGLWTVFT